jgi:nucleoside-diphosphate-sugar epimerase
MAIPRCFDREHDSEPPIPVRCFKTDRGAVLQGLFRFVRAGKRCTRDFTYVQDVVQANIRAMQCNARGIFNVAYCQQISLNSLASLIMEITGFTVPVLYEPPRPGDIRNSLADIRAAQQELRYTPEYSVKTGLGKTIAWYQNH